ncbi:MAG: TetR/AcrR family transcriptional regulator [Gordonia sp. (in: high G+C Gram-positive bacteria)]
MTPEARRDQLIALGLEMVGRRPLEEISIDAIAAEAGVSRALLFHYFDSKQDFHVAIARAQGEQMLDCTAPDDSLGGPIEILAGSLSAFVDYVSDHRMAYTTFLRGSASADPAMRAVIDTTREKMVDRVLRYAPDLGIEVTPLVRMSAFGWIAFVEEVTIGWLADTAISRNELLSMIVASLPAIASATGMVAASS